LEKEDMPNAIALNSIQFNVAVMVGPALAGQALAKLGEKWCLRPKCCFISSTQSFLSQSSLPVPAGEDEPNQCQQPQAGNSIRAQSDFHGGSDYSGLLHDRP